MASIVLSSLFSDASGSEGGLTFQRNASGLIVRNRIKPVNGLSNVACIQRAAMQSQIMQWRSMTESDKGLWRSATPSGMRTIDFFTQTNLNLIKFGQPPITVPPTPVVLNFYTVHITADHSTMDIMIYLSAALAVSEIGYVSISALLSPGISNLKSRLKFVGVIPSGFSVVNLGSQYISSWGFHIQQNWQLIASLQVCSPISGQCLTPVYSSCIIS